MAKIGASLLGEAPFKVPNAPPAPDPNDPLQLLKQRQKFAQTAATGGRQGTIYSSGGDYAGGKL